MLTVEQILEVDRLMTQTPRSYVTDTPATTYHHSRKYEETSFEFREVTDRKTGDVRLVRVKKK